jgi:hypothetical protein
MSDIDPNSCDEKTHIMSNMFARICYLLFLGDHPNVVGKDKDKGSENYAVGYKPYENPDAGVCLDKSGCKNRPYLDLGDCFFVDKISIERMKELRKILSLPDELPVDKRTTTNKIEKT